MIITSCKYNPVADLAAVEPFGFINLSEAMEKGEIPSGIANSEVTYNDIEDPSTIVGKPRDIFEAYRMVDGLKTAYQSRIAKESTEE